MKNIRGYTLIFSILDFFLILFLDLLDFEELLLVTLTVEVEAFYYLMMREVLLQSRLVSVMLDRVYPSPFSVGVS